MLAGLVRRDPQLPYGCIAVAPRRVKSPLPLTGRRSMLEGCRRDGRRQDRMKVVLAEKPSVARELASFLGATQRHDGYLEGRGYQVT